MNQVTSTAIVNAPIARVWETIADVGTIADWHPGVAKSPVLTGHRTGMGAARRVELYDGGSSVETVTSLKEGHSVSVTMTDHTMPMSVGIATFAVEADGDERTRVSMTFAYEMKYGPLGWMLNVLMLRGIMVKVTSNTLAGLDHHLLTGEQIGKDFKPQAA